MTDSAFGKSSWQDFLPPVHAWIDSVKMQETASIPEKGAVVLAVNTTAQKRVTLLSSQVAPEVKKEIESVIGSVSWSPSNGAFRVASGDRLYVLVPWSQQKVTAQQLARQFGIDTATALRDCQLDSVSFCLPDQTDPLAVFDGLASGFYQAQLFKGPKSSSTRQLPGTISFVGTALDSNRQASQIALSRAVVLARLLQDAPANWLTPTRFAEVGADIAKEGGLKCRILGLQEMQDEKMGAFLSVAAGSALEPKTIVIEVEGDDTSKTVALVGKGLTFDTGGVSIKPSVGMEEMKYDMSGGAAVLGAAHYFSRVKPPVNVVLVVGAVENMCSGTATRPGDIVVARNGKSIEVINTDAEGRLVLADILNYAATEYKPDLIIDAATLTGAVLMALGHCGAGIMSNDSEMANFVKRAGDAAGEPGWELPIWPELGQEVRSEFADLANIAKPNVKAGTIIGAVFLREFVEDCKWVHLDIAGTAWQCRATGYPSNAGGSAYGVRTMVESCLRWGK